MPSLLLGPILRHVGRTEATVWVETDEPCTVTVVGRGAPTFEINGHHYGIVLVRGLTPGTRYPYAVELDGKRVWPEGGSPYPPSCIRTLGGSGPIRLLFGSCRLSAPHSPPYTLHPDRHEQGRGVDALTAMAEHLRSADSDDLPHLVLHLGDQVYSDELSPPVQAFVRSRRRSVAGPAHEVVDFEEFTRLYTDAWSEPTLRWLFSTVANVMIFDDHDIHDDWNTSLAWRERVERLPWWHSRMVAGLMSYWVYQHAGNVGSAGLAREGLLERLQRQTGDAAPLLREFAEQALAQPAGCRWSYVCDLGAARLVVVDSRASRVLEDGRRDMLDDGEWRWLEQALEQEASHLLVVSTLPVFLPAQLHYLEAWNEAVCAGAWGRWAEGFGEWLRQALDLEHWAAFQRSFARLAGLLTGVASGDRSWLPSTVICLGGDVHFGYVAEIERRHTAAPLLQVTASPMRNRLVPWRLRAMRLGMTKPAGWLNRGLALLARVQRPPVTWRLSQGTWFGNHIAELSLDGARARLAVRESVAGRHPTLRTRLLMRLDRPGDQ